MLPRSPDKGDVMGKIVVTEFMSLDGVVEDPGGAEDYEHGGWSFAISRGDEGFADAWPQRDGDFADKFNTMPKYVVSSTLRDPEWTNSTVIDGDLATAI